MSCMPYSNGMLENISSVVGWVRTGVALAASPVSLEQRRLLQHAPRPGALAGAAQRQRRACRKDSVRLADLQPWLCYSNTKVKLSISALVMVSMKQTAAHQSCQAR